MKRAKSKKTKKQPVKKKSAKATLNVKQRKFCELFCTTREFFGNGVQSYIEAYDINLSKHGAYNSAANSARNLLKNTDILAYINELLERVSLNEAHVDKQLAFLITQNADFGAKLGAIREFNALRQRITKKFKGTMSLAGAVHEAMKDE